MRIELELWQLITLLLAFFGAVGVAARLLFDTVLRHLNANHLQLTERLGAIEEANREEARQWQRVERELLELKADLPMRFVQREDYIRGQSVIEVKIDALAMKIENMQLRGIRAAGGRDGN